MIKALIQWSIHNRFLVLLSSLLLLGIGLYSVKQTPVDAIPDLSDVQVIVKTSYPGQAPQVVEDQVTYPLTTALMAVPGADTVRGFSFFGDSYVYVIFSDDTDMYWARSRVLEYLSQVAPELPPQAKPQLGPDATGVGWVYMYALTSPDGTHDLQQLRSLQDWFLKFELQALEGVSEVAAMGGMVKQYQIEVDPQKLRAYQMPLSHIETAINKANQEMGASVVEMAEAEYMVRTTGYIQSIEDLQQIPLGQVNNGTPLLLADVADIYVGPKMRRGVVDLNGQGEVVGGVVVMRYGENAAAVIEAVKDKLATLQQGLPEGVEVVTVYDRSELINSAVNNLWQKLLEEFLLVALISMLFLWHLRSSMVAIISLPIGILTAFIVMHLQGLNANIMSLGGIAIAIGAMIDGAIVMVENMHKHLEETPLTKDNRWQIVSQSAVEVGPALFFSLLIITVSFVPVFTLEDQEGRMFSPLAFTKTYAMAASAALAITLVPVLMGYFVRGKIRPEHKNPLNRGLSALYEPILKVVLNWPKSTVLLALILMVVSVWPIQKIGSEFMPPLNEGDIMYMPTTHPAISIAEARFILQQTNKLIKTVPEVETVFGKVGRAETATDPAPLTMIETFIHLKPQSQWRADMNQQDIINELDAKVQFPGLTNAWVMPIKTRIDMLATGIKTPVGIKVSGPELAVIETIGQDIEQALEDFPGTASVYAERVAGGRYITLDINRKQAARYQMSVAEIQAVIAGAVGGRQVTQTIEGLERYSVNLRYPQSYRDNPEQLALLPIVTSQGATISLGDVADIRIENGPPGIKSENARLNGWIYVDINDSDMGRYVQQARNHIQKTVNLPTGYAINWAGQYEYMQRAKEKLSYVVPLTLGIIILLLYMNFRNLTEVAIIMGTLPLSLVGSLWLMYWIGFNFSVAVAVGFIALAGVAVEIGVIMLVYLNQAYEKLLDKGKDINAAALREAVMQGAGRRMRPVMMTSLSIIIGLLPVLLGSGTGSQMMSRIAAPMIGGMVSALLLTLLVLPAVYYLWRSRSLSNKRNANNDLI